MNVENLLGEREGQDLEFEAAAVLSAPAKVAREVVAMLNSSGGEVWIGVREESGAAVAFEPIEDVERRRESLLDELIDRIDPTPRGEEVVVETVRIPREAGSVLRIVVANPDVHRTPFMWREKGLFGIAYRNGHRLVPLRSMEELRDAIGAQEAGDVQRPEDVLSALLEPRGDHATSTIAFTLRDGPSGEAEFSDATRRSWSDLIERARSHRSALRSARFWSSLLSRAGTSKLRAVEPDAPAGRGRVIEVRASGSVSFTIETMSLVSELPGADPSTRVSTMHPYFLIAWIRRACEVAAWAYARDELHLDTELICDLRIGGADRMVWLPHSPRSSEWQFWRDDLEERRPAAELRLDQALRPRRERLLESPDAVACDLIVGAYESAGFVPEEVPFEVDRGTKTIRDD